MSQSGHHSPLPPSCHGRRKVFSEQGHQKGWKGMERECSDAEESFPCAAAASAGTGAAEQERGCGRARRARSELPPMGKIPGGLQKTNRPLHQDSQFPVSLLSWRVIIPISLQSALTPPRSFRGRSRAAAGKSQNPALPSHIPACRGFASQQSWSRRVLAMHPKMRWRGGEAEPTPSHNIPKDLQKGISTRNLQTRRDI